MTARPQNPMPAAIPAVPRGRVQKLTTMVRRFGWRQSLETVWLWTLRQAVGYRSAIVYRLDLAELEESASCRRFQWDYKPAAEIAPPLWHAAEIREADAASPDVRFFVGESNHDQCYLSLVSSRGFSIPDRFSVAFAGATEAYVGNCITLDSYRGLGAYPCGLLELGLRLRADGRRWLYLFVERENLASVRGVEKAGFRPIARCSVVHWKRYRKQSWKIIPGISSADSVAHWNIQPGNS